jgi:hemerythrin
MWKEAYLLGVPHIDEQHRNLFKTITALKENLSKPGTPESKKQLIETLLYLRDYCVNHFKDEEQYQLEIKYAGYDAHKAIHEKLVAQVLDYVKEFKATDFAEEVVMRFLGFVTTWVIYHIGMEDQQIPKGASKPEALIPDREFLIEYAAKLRHNVAVFTGLPQTEIKYKIGCGRQATGGIIYTVGLVGAKDNTNVAFKFSREAAFGIFKAMTGLSLTDYDEMVYSSLREIANISAAHAAGLLSEPLKIPVDIKAPELAQPGDIPDGITGILLTAIFGDMEVFIY